MTKILQVAPSYYPTLQDGGPPQKIHDLSRALAGRGHSVQVATLRAQRRAGSARVEGIEVAYLPWLGGGQRRLPVGPSHLRRLVAWADVVHGYGLYNMIVPEAAFLARRLGRPFLLEPQGMTVPRLRRQRLKRLYHRLFTNRMIEHAAVVIATSPAEIADLEALVPAGKLVLRRNGIDVAAFQDLPAADDLRARFGLGQARLILFLGRISPIKNLEQLIAAYAQVAPADSRLLLVGPMTEQEYARRLRRQIEALGLRPRVLLTGPLYGRKKLAAFGAADLFVLPSLYESYGNAAAEAVAAGLPVLLTHECGIAPLINGRAGLAVAPEASALAEGLRTLLQPAHREALTRRRAEVVAELSWDEPLAQMEAIYHNLLPASRRTKPGLRPERLRENT